MIYRLEPSKEALELLLLAVSIAVDCDLPVVALKLTKEEEIDRLELSIEEELYLRIEETWIENTDSTSLISFGLVSSNSVCGSPS